MTMGNTNVGPLTQLERAQHDKENKTLSNAKRPITQLNVGLAHYII